MMSQDPMNEPATNQPVTSWGRPTTGADPSETAGGPPRRRRGTVAAVGLLAAGAIAGGVLAGSLTASAETTVTPSSTSSVAGSPDGAVGSGAAAGQQGQSGRQDGPRGGGGPRLHGSAPVRDDEKALSAADAAKVKAAALTAVPGGTVYRVETDAGDGEYEAHLTKADGTEVTVELDAAFAVTGVEDGMGQGDPAPQGAPSSAPSAAPSTQG